MGSLEEFHVRLRGGNRQQIIADLWESLSYRENVNGLSGLNLYSHAKMKPIFVSIFTGPGKYHQTAANSQCGLSPDYRWNNPAILCAV